MIGKVWSSNGPNLGTNGSATAYGSLFIHTIPTANGRRPKALPTMAPALRQPVLRMLRGSRLMSAGANTLSVTPPIPMVAKASWKSTLIMNIVPLTTTMILPTRIPPLVSSLWLRILFFFSAELPISDAYLHYSNPGTPLGDSIARQAVNPRGKEGYDGQTYPAKSYGESCDK